MNSPTARPVVLLLNVAHAIDHMFLLIFATAVAAIAADFGFADWESLMPYGVGAFLLFGLGSLPAGRLGDLWGRRQMMLIFFSEWAFRCCWWPSRATRGSSRRR
jgi:MFS family permease